MKKIILATLVSSLISASALAVDAGHGTVKFTGSIIEAPCSIAPGAENQEIPLGQVSNVILKAGGASSAQPITIQLEGCNLEGDNEVTVTFAGSAAMNGTTATDFLQIIGEAKGAAVKLMDESGATIKVNSGYVQKYIAGDQTLKFQAALQGLDGETVVPGEFYALTKFTLTYN